MSRLFGRVDRTGATALSRRIGAGHLAVAGLVNVGIGVALHSWVGSGSSTDLALSILTSVWSETTVLEQGDLLHTVFEVAPVVAAGIVVLGMTQVAVAVAAARGRYYRLSLATAISGSVTVVTIPLTVVAMGLFWYSAGRFERAGHLSRASKDA